MSCHRIVGVVRLEAFRGPIAENVIRPDADQEAGSRSDTGEIKRHRAFYIFDRTIPVGFERGENHNVEKAVLLRSFIE